MTEHFVLEIITPQHVKSCIVEWVSIESPTGSFFVGPGHSPLVSIIKTQSTIAYKPQNEAESFLTANHGIFKVDNQKAIILLE